MELNDFKKAWQQAETDKGPEKELDVSGINLLLRHRGKGILSRLDRSVKIGMWFLVIFFLLTVADQVIPADLIFPEEWKTSIIVPRWISLLEWAVNFLLMITIFLFIYRYRRLQVHRLADQDLKSAIQKVLSLLDTFKKAFYLAVMILMSGMGLGFLSGVYKGLQNVEITRTPTTLSILLIASSMLFLFCLLIGTIFYIFHKGFNLLFGKYRDQLIKSLNELQENEE